MNARELNVLSKNCCQLLVRVHSEQLTVNSSRRQTQFNHSRVQNSSALLGKSGVWLKSELVKDAYYSLVNVFPQFRLEESIRLRIEKWFRDFEYFICIICLVYFIYLILLLFSIHSFACFGYFVVIFVCFAFVCNNFFVF